MSDTLIEYMCVSALFALYVELHFIQTSGFFLLKQRPVRVNTDTEDAVRSLGVATTLNQGGIITSH